MISYLQVYKLSYHVNKFYIFKLLDLIDEVEFAIKKWLNLDAKLPKKLIPDVSSDANTHSNDIETSEDILVDDATQFKDAFDSPESEARLCVQYIVRDFINSWYKEFISDENQTIEEAQEMLEQLMLQAFEQTKSVDVMQLVQSFIGIFHDHVKNFQEAERYWKQQPYYKSKRQRDKPEFKKVRDVITAFRVGWLYLLSIFSFNFVLFVLIQSHWYM